MFRHFLFLVLLALPVAASTSASANATILIFGDSLSAGYGIAVDRSWPALLAKRIEDNRLGYAVSNASISGETTAGGRARLADTIARLHPAVVVIALGANDGLRGLPVAQMRDNLAAMIRAAKAARARVLLVGMKVPPNYGPDYAHQFEQAFVQAAREERVPLLPFLLEPLGTGRDDFQADGLHPTAAAQPKLLDHVWANLKPLLRK